MVNIVMNVILMVLLAAALMFGMRLDKRLKALRAAHEGFAKAVHDLDDAAIRAHNSLKELRGHADESQDLLHGRILAARDVLQKLDLQVTRAERVQTEMEKGMASYSALRQTLPERQPERQPERLPEPRPEPPLPPRQTPEIIRPAHYEPETLASRHERPKEMPLAQTPYVRKGRSLLPDFEPEDEGEMIDKVQMSELVVANLNEMIRSLNLPTRQASSVEDDLFGGAGREDTTRTAADASLDTPRGRPRQFTVKRP
ncbi:MAG: DUF6468 domain-containing protein [Asticcacaulis sp.]|uniref:DUF6468 domain-containing protein n=1 Tax=Asticcacaulis sp. TaxID=1872648 RepID=UPI0039E3154A